jgi:hypothetical protein
MFELDAESLKKMDRIDVTSSFVMYPLPSASAGSEVMGKFCLRTCLESVYKNGKIHFFADEVPSQTYRRSGIGL